MISGWGGSVKCYATKNLGATTLYVLEADLTYLSHHWMDKSEKKHTWGNHKNITPDWKRNGLRKLHTRVTRVCSFWRPFLLWIFICFRHSSKIWVAFLFWIFVRFCHSNFMQNFVWWFASWKSDYYFCAHGTAAQLLCHVQNVVVITSLKFGLWPAISP